MARHRFIRLAGIDWVFEGLPEGMLFTPFWTPFEFHGQPSSTAGLFTYSTDPCPVAPSGPPINANPYFHLFRTPGGNGLLGIPVPEAGWCAISRPDRGRLELYVERQSDPALAGALVDSTFWRFRSFLMAPANRLVMHATAAVRHGRALVLTGDTGRGKSTLAALLHQAGWTILSDESPVVEAPPHEPFRAWGSPWPSSMGFACDGCGILAGIFFIEHGLVNKITPLAPGQAVRRLLSERLFICPWFEDWTRDRILDAVDRLLLGAPCAVLSFKPDADVVALLEKE